MKLTKINEFENEVFLIEVDSLLILVEIGPWDSEGWKVLLGETFKLSWEPKVFRTEDLWEFIFYLLIWDDAFTLLLIDWLTKICCWFWVFDSKGDLL